MFFFAILGNISSILSLCFPWPQICVNVLWCLDLARSGSTPPSFSSFLFSDPSCPVFLSQILFSRTRTLGSQSSLFICQGPRVGPAAARIKPSSAVPYPCWAQHSVTGFGIKCADTSLSSASLMCCAFLTIVSFSSGLMHQNPHYCLSCSLLGPTPSHRPLVCSVSLSKELIHSLPRNWAPQPEHLFHPFPMVQPCYSHAQGCSHCSTPHFRSHYLGPPCASTFEISFSSPASLSPPATLFFTCCSVLTMSLEENICLQKWECLVLKSKLNKNIIFNIQYEK